VVARIEEVAQKAAVTDGLEVVEVELKGSGNSQMLRIYIDKSPGVTHADCELISRHVSEFLDSEDLLPGHYTLEVSSPGVERKRRKLQDLEGFQGQRAKVVLREPLEDVRRFEGVLQAAQDGAFKMELRGGRSVQLGIAVNRKPVITAGRKPKTISLKRLRSAERLATRLAKQAYSTKLLVPSAASIV